MTEEKELYDGVTRKSWLEELSVHDGWNRRHMYSVFSLIGTPRTMLDIGCGTGKSIQMARNIGIDAFGIDQLVDREDGWPEYFFEHDLRTPFSLADHGGPSVVDLVVCLEVAEHIPADNHDIFCDTVCNHLMSGDGSKLIFSSAHPGQGGINHEAERPAKFWRDKFHERGLTYRHEMSVELSLLWSHIHSPLYWLAANVQVFDK